MSWLRRKHREHDLEREARYAAHRAFGNTALIQEEIRAMWTWAPFDRFAKDLRYALRTIRHQPVFSFAAILSLALGIGANTAIFSLMDALLWRSLPVRNPHELVQLFIVQRDRRIDSFSYPSVAELSGLPDIFEGAGGFSAATFSIASPEGFERVKGSWVSGGFYPTLGLEPFAGRLLTPEDDRPGAPPVAVLSFSFWANHFARDFGVVGRSLSISGKPVTIVGVAPRGFDGAEIGEVSHITLPLAALPQIFPERIRQLEAGSEWLRMLARPRPGLSIAQAKARLAVVWPRLAVVATTPQMDPERRQVLLNSAIDLAPGASGYSYFRRQLRQPLLILLWITALVLLIACANFANLLLARGAARSKEIALRFAIGAGRGRIVSQLLTESLTLSMMGAALGVVLAISGGRLLLALLPGGAMLDLRPDMRVLLFTTAVALLTGILFGLAPALRATAAGPGAALKADAGITPRTRSRLLPALVVSQVALSLVLLFGAGLFVRTLQNLEHLDPGFRPEGVLLVNLDARRTGLQDARLSALYQEVLNRFAVIPGVVSASISYNTPLNGGYWSDAVSINGQPLSKAAANLNAVGPRYFETMGIPLVLGRDVDEHDNSGATPVGIVNEAFIKKFLPGSRPLGQQVATSNPRLPAFQIVGVVKDTITRNLREEIPQPSLYMSYLQVPEQIATATYEIRVSGPMARPAALVRDELRTQFPRTAVNTQIEGMTEQVRRTLSQERMMAGLGAGFGVLALVLAAVGLYGLLAYSVARSTNEIGIRLALGAQRQDVLRGVLQSALRLLGLGLAIGIPAAWVASRLIASLLFGATPRDPLTTVAAALLLGVVALLAALLPAIRAARVDLMVALRYE